MPGVGLTAIPQASMEPLRAFIYGGVRGILIPPARRPAPFTTYHTVDDAPETLELPTLAAVETALDALICTRRGGARPLAATAVSRAPRVRRVTRRRRRTQREVELLERRAGGAPRSRDCAREVQARR